MQESGWELSGNVCGYEWSSHGWNLRNITRLDALPPPCVLYEIMNWPLICHQQLDDCCHRSVTAVILPAAPARTDQPTKVSLSPFSYASRARRQVPCTDGT